jgi:hypothetical protein
MAEEDVNAVVREVLGSLYTLAYCCRVLSKPQYVNANGIRAIDNGDGTVTYGSLVSVAPQNVRWLLKRVSHIVCHTARRVGKRVKKRATWVDREGVQKYAEKEVVCGTRHVFVRGELVLPGIVGDRIKL